MDITMKKMGKLKSNKWFRTETRKKVSKWYQRKGEL